MPALQTGTLEVIPIGVRDEIQTDYRVPVAVIPTPSMRATEDNRTPWREAVGGCGESETEAQNSVISAGGRSIPPVAASPPASSSPRKITALRGAKSSRLLLKRA